MKKILMAVAAMLLMSGIFTSVSFAAEFPDVKQGDRFYDEITYLTNDSIIFGFPDGTFQPGGEVTRAQAAIMIGRALGYDGTQPQTEFPDADGEASGYIAKLTSEGIINGYPDGTFRPGNVVTRAEMAILLDRAFVPGAVEGSEFFTDVGPNMNAYESIATLSAMGVAMGYPDATFRPSEELNRQQFAAFLARVLNPEQFVPERVSVSDMTLNEKIGQMVIAGLDGTSLTTPDERLMTDYHVGGFIFYGDNLETRQQSINFVNEVKAANQGNKLPLFISVDQEGGRVARLPGVNTTPSNKAIGETNDPDYAYSIGQTLGQQLNSMGFNLDYAPVLDINSNPDNPVIGDRSYGDNADIVSRMGIQTMKGIQSENIIPVIKHFPGHGDTSVDSHLELPRVTKSLNQLEQLELIPFKKAIDEGANVVMIAHILLSELDADYPASMSETVITELLRNQLDFNGVVITDDMTMGAIADNYGMGEAAVKSVEAGSDIVLVAHGNQNVIDVIEAIKAAVEDGEISERSINESVQRIISLKRAHLGA
ncbi:beta-N-acetylhexosaminidase [Salimicrobium flavidum]|uniref:beta-N-acetylhexosaminidase n=1 Tax=Salimicrobium flavidum TaxID=570947 RepID=A0A1N7KMG6_9BACI|nr:beta-N-acetylhexosaminidase [Salimicrobium flavidum]SIS62747.1 beta-glucosidase [Salimicrobium flavidum]